MSLRYPVCVSNQSEDRLQICEFGDRLEFSLELDNNRISLVGAGLAFLLVGAFIVYCAPLYLVVISCFTALLSAAHAIAGRMQGNTVKLLVREDGVLARGPLGKLLSAETSVAVVDIEGIAYWQDFESNHSEIVVKRRFGQETLLPRVTRQEAELVLEAIHRKFPYLPVDQDLHDWRLGDFGWNASKPITLGLSEPKREEDSNPK